MLDFAAMRSDNRFAFGRNWSGFLSVVNGSHVEAAVQSLSAKLGDIRGKTFLDIGSGSGIHSLAAARLGAKRIYSFDYDMDSVRCTQELKKRFAPDFDWTITQGSALDKTFLSSLGEFDIVYSWGVLHHTGDMWNALDFARIPLSKNGLLFVAIYNDQGSTSKRWAALKRRYNQGGWISRRFTELVTFYDGWGRYFLHDLAMLKWSRTLQQWRQYSSHRGMSPWHDIVDWAGGYPFEVATPDAVFDFYRDRGLTLQSLKTCGGGKGCNEFIFRVAPSVELLVEATGST